MSELQLATEGLTQTVGIIAPADRARRWRRWRTDFQGLLKAYDIRSTVKLLGEEEERRSIMPKVERLQGSQPIAPAELIAQREQRMSATHRVAASTD